MKSNPGLAAFPLIPIIMGILAAVPAVAVIFGKKSTTTPTGQSEIERLLQRQAELEKEQQRQAIIAATQKKTMDMLKLVGIAGLAITGIVIITKK